MQLFKALLASAAIFGIALAVPAGKPTGGPASAQVTIFSGPFTCTDANTPPKAGTAGTTSTVTVSETHCAVINIPFGGAFTANMINTPKTGAAGCYIQVFTQQGCGVTLQNQYHGFAFNGITSGSAVGCAQPPVQSYGALQIVCG